MVEGVSPTEEDPSDVESERLEAGSSYRVALKRASGNPTRKRSRHNYFANPLKCVVMGIDCSKRGTAVKFHEKWGQAVKLTNRKGE